MRYRWWCLGMGKGRIVGFESVSYTGVEEEVENTHFKSQYCV